MVEKTETKETGIAQGELIYQRMANVMRDIDAIVKKKQSSGVNYAFRSIEDVMNTIHPVLSEHQVLVVPTGHTLKNNTFEKGQGKFSYQAILTSTYRFYTTDGSFVEASMCAESIDYSDKATQQASSYIYKNLILQTFCVPTKELMSDGDGKQPDREGEKPVSPAGQALAATKLADRPPLPKVAEDALAAMPETMNDVMWGKIKERLAPFNLTDTAWAAWIVQTLRANHIIVPAQLSTLSVEIGRKLYQVADLSATKGELLHTLEAFDPPPPIVEAPAAPVAIPTPAYSGPPSVPDGDEFV